MAMELSKRVQEQTMMIVNQQIAEVKDQVKQQEQKLIDDREERKRSIIP